MKKRYEGSDPIAIELRDSWEIITNALGPRSNNKAAELIGKKSGVSPNTLRIYFMRQEFLEAHAKNFYLDILRKFLKKYDTPEKIKNAYLKSVMGVPEGYITIDSLAQKAGTKKATIMYYWRKKHPLMFIGHTQGRNLYVNPKILETETAKMALDTTQKDLETLWEEISALRDETVKFFNSPAAMCNEIENRYGIKSNSAYVTLFYRRKKRNHIAKKGENLRRYLKILQELKATHI